jgi:manganese/zinc/iron transport system permease protein
MNAALSPYHFADFPHFFIIFFHRMCLMMTGEITWGAIVSDELQLFVLIFTSISAGMVGVFLMLRRMAMLANSLSHTILLGIVIAFLVHQMGAEGTTEVGGGGHDHDMIGLPVLLFAAMVTGIFTTFFTQALTNFFHLPEDASNGLVFSTLFAMGVVLVTLFTRNAHIGVEAVMGNVDMLQSGDLTLAVVTCLVNGVIFFLFFKEYKLTTFDPGLALALGFSPVAFNYLLMTQVSFTAVSAFRSVGVLMVLAFIIGPPLTARLFTHRLGYLLGLSAAIGSTASIIGVALSRHFLAMYNTPLSTGGLIVCLIAFFYFLGLMLAPEQGVLAQWWRRHGIAKSMEQ